ncbi:cytochrome c oxidase subunit II [Marinobacter sp. C2H3]|uniref:cytochrome c oxidase subunit II n=1 Tax=Marinobacter sp. C2H3 TaxID=3119003 RepID=UPI00300EB3F8
MCVWARRTVALLVGLVTAMDASADWTVNLRPGATGISHDIFGLHMAILWICVAIGVVVFGVMFYAIVAHRKSRGHKPARFHENTTVEVLWTLIPSIILVIMVVPATATLMDIYDTSGADLDIRITGYQWKWRYQYVDDDFGYFSNLVTPQDQIHNRQTKNEHYLLEVDNPLVLPVGRKIRFLVTSNDVIHSWWVPDLGVKKDAIPGYINETWTRIDKPGLYRGQCAELCGKNHGFMPVVVKAVPAPEYAAWVSDQKAAAEQERLLTEKDWTLEELVARGEQVYQTTCAACHQPDGSGAPPAFPALNGSPVATGDANGHIEVVLNGRQGTAMQAFGKQLSEVDLAAVITYERNAWGNHTGDKVTPQDIVAYRKQHSSP